MARDWGFLSGAAFLWMAALAGVCAGQGPATPVPSSGLEAAEAVERALVEVIARAEKSVVAIARVRRAPPGEMLNLETRPDPFGRRILAPPVPRPADPDFIPTEYATGVVVDRRGWVLTVYHVLGEQSDYYVSTYDRRVYRAKLAAADPRSDLAVLAPDEEFLPRPNAIDLPTMSLGDAAGLRKGQIAVCLGNPFAMARDGQASASWGILANLGRKAPASPDEPELGKPTLHHFGTLIQTDAKLNLGTSGGPLLNLKGEMVGLTTSIPAVPGFDAAAGYAMPVDATFRRVLEALRQGREVEYGFLGVQLQRIAGEDLGLGVQGTRVEKVLPGMPAARSGIRPGDVIAAVNGAPIRDPDALVLEVSKLPLDAVVRLGLLRGQRRMDLEVELTKYRVQGKKVVTNPSPDWRGMRIDYVTALDDALAAGHASGPSLLEAVAVIDVKKGTPAWESGLRPGMFVSHVDRTAVRTPAQFRAAVSTRSGSVRLQLAGEAPAAGSRTITVPGA